MFTETTRPCSHVKMPKTDSSQHCRECSLRAEDCGHTHTQTELWIITDGSLETNTQNPNLKQMKWQHLRRADTPWLLFTGSSQRHTSGSGLWTRPDCFLFESRLFGLIEVCTRIPLNRINKFMHPGGTWLGCCTFSISYLHVQHCFYDIQKYGPPTIILNVCVYWSVWSKQDHRTTQQSNGWKK